MLRAGMAAPSAGNQQPWEFYVVRDKKILQDLSHCSLYAGCAAKAPVAIVVCSRDDNMRFRAFANLDLSACVEIFCWSCLSGLGAVWLGVAAICLPGIERTAGLLGIPKGLTAFAVIPFGYAADTVEERAKEDRFDPDRIHYV